MDEETVADKLTIGGFIDHRCPGRLGREKKTVDVRLASSVAEKSNKTIMNTPNKNNESRPDATLLGVFGFQ